ncbi:Nucleolar protein 58 [Balamuthia mandrillaris]
MIFRHRNEERREQEKQSVTAEEEEAAAADFKVKKGLSGNKKTFDSRLNTEGAVLEFATLNASKPATYVHQHAQHTESYTDSKGNRHTRTVVDLDKWTDITTYVAEDWEWKNDEGIELYFKSNATLKRLAITKCVDDLPNLCQNVTSIVSPHYTRSRYYCQVQTKGATTYIYPDTNASKAWRSPWMVTGFFIGGLIIGGVIFLGVRHAATKTYKANMYYPYLIEEDAIWEEFQDRFTEGTRVETARNWAKAKQEKAARKAEKKAAKEKEKALKREEKERKKAAKRQKGFY